MQPVAENGANQHIGGVRDTKPSEQDDATGEDDIRAFINAQNAHRRNVSTGQKAMAVADQLAVEGKRANGRWKRSTVIDESPLAEDDSAAWIKCMTRAGLVIDHLPELADQVISGEVALSDAADRAAKKRDEINVPQMWHLPKSPAWTARPTSPAPRS